MFFVDLALRLIGINALGVLGAVACGAAWGDAVRHQAYVTGLGLLIFVPALVIYGMLGRVHKS
jgi:hypothetical protein